MEDLIFKLRPFRAAVSFNLTLLFADEVDISQVIIFQSWAPGNFEKCSLTFYTLTYHPHNTTQPTLRSHESQPPNPLSLQMPISILRPAAKNPGRSKTSVLTLLNFISESHLTDYTGKRFPLALTAHNPSKFFVSLCEVDKDKDIPEYLALLPFAAFNALNSIHFWGRGLMF